MAKLQMKKRTALLVGFLSAFAVSSVASVPRSGSSMAIQPDVSEIRAKRHQELTFDQDIKRLSQLQGRYRENLPLLKRKLAKPAATKASKKISKKPAKLKRSGRG